MAARAFYDEAAERSVAQAIERIEAKTSAEVMVAVRAVSGQYGDADCIIGFLLSFAGLLVFLFHPAPIRIEYFALEFPISFGIGMALSAWVPPLRRLASSRERRTQSATQAARAAFVEMGVSRTQARTGILVFVSMFERQIVVVTDIGVEREKLGNALGQLESALEPEPELGRFVATLEALAEPLSRALPRAEDDQNELPDTVTVT